MFPFVTASLPFGGGTFGGPPPQVFCSAPADPSIVCGPCGTQGSEVTRMRRALSQYGSMTARADALADGKSPSCTRRMRSFDHVFRDQTREPLSRYYNSSTY